MKSAAKRVPLEIELNALAEMAERYSPEVAEFLREDVAYAAALSNPHTPRLLAIIPEGPIQRAENGDPILNLSKTYRLYELFPRLGRWAGRSIELQKGGDDDNNR